MNLPLHITYNDQKASVRAQILNSSQNISMVRDMDCRAVSNTFLDIVALLLWSALGRLAAAPITELSFGFDVEEKMEVQPNENSATLFSTKAERINVQSSTNMDNLNPDC